MFRIYFSLGRFTGWIPIINVTWGESTHFVHLEDRTSLPLNKEWSITFLWTVIHIDISYTIDSAEYKKWEKEDDN